MFTTERLRLRALKAADHDAILELYNIPEVAKWTVNPASYLTPLTEEKFKDTYIKSFAESLMFCTAEERETGEFVGFGNFMKMSPKNRNAMFGIAIAPKHQNKGYGKEITKFMVDYAFHNLGVHRVSLGVLGGNERAIAMYKKIGFVEEGRIRKSAWFEGAWQDEVLMGILEDEWAELRAKA